MKTILYLLPLALLLTACGQNPKSSDSAENPSSASAETEEPDEANDEDLDEPDDDYPDDDLSDGGITKAFVSLSTGDSTIQLIANIRQDHRIFGYARPDTVSERLLLLSVFTEDVENNPFKCKLGAYYETSGMEDLILKYVATHDDYVVAHAIDKSDKKTPIYFEKKWIEFE